MILTAAVWNVLVAVVVGREMAPDVAKAELYRSGAMMDRIMERKMVRCW